jgi:phospholipase/lecithinase/hemolysin
MCAMEQLRSGRSAWSALTLVAAGLWLVGSAHGGEITGIVSFGDSLTDVGNFYAATGGASPPAPYYPGNFTNGLNWVQYLAQDLGVAAPTASSSGGTDYAYGGATTGTGTTTVTFLGATATVPNIGTQIDTYLASHTPTAGQLFTIWGGANDFLYAGQTNPYVPAENIAAEITQLAQAGARQFLIPNLPALGLLPATSSLPAPIPSELNTLAADFDAILQGEAAQLEQQLGVQIHIVDVYSLLNNVIADPSQYGFTNVTDSALLSGSNGSGYLFWDTIHPTTQADQFIGGLAAQSVPEPSSLVLLGIAITIAAGRVWFSRRVASTAPRSCPSRPGLG